MKKEKTTTRFKQVVSAALASGMLMSSAGIFPTASAADCTIDTGVTYQRIAGFGGMNHPEWQSVNTQYGAGGDMTAAQVQTAFGNGDDELGLTILRIFVSDDSNAWKNAVPTAQRAQALGATVFATPWNPPASMRSAGGGTDQTGLYVLNNGAEPQYAQHLNNYIKYMEGQGINLYSISVQNEPDYSREWTFWSPERAANFIANYGQAVKDGTSCKLMSPESFQYGPESWGYGKNYYKTIINNQNAFANCDLFGTHFYGTSRDSMDYPTVENSGKEIWMTEVYVPNSDANSADIWSQALQAAENIHNGLVVGNMSAYVWWYIRRQYSLMWDDGRISKRGRVMGQYSKWVRPDAYRIGATEQPATNVLCSAYKNADGSIAIVAINKNDSQVNQNFTLSGGEKITSLDCYMSDANNDWKKSTLSYSDTSFSATLPAGSISTFVIGAGEPEPDPDGYYFHDTFETSAGSWSGRSGNETIAASASAAYAGSQSLSVTGRTSAWHGATRPLTSQFKAGQTYSFSVDVMYNTGSATDTFHLSLQYKGSDGETHYAKVVEGVTVAKGEWTQLANPAYTIPADATNIQLYVETAESSTSFFIDEAIGAPEGTVIDGPKPVTFTLGDVDGNGKINAADMTLAKRIVLGSLNDAAAKKAADVDGNGSVELADIVWYVKFLTGETDAFPTAQTTTGGGTQSQEFTSGTMRTISEYTPTVASSYVEFDDQGDRTNKGGVGYGTLKHEQYFSSVANKNKPYYILLPENYDTGKKYPVLYVMHGYWETEERMIVKGNGTMYTQQLIGNAIASGAAKEMIVVFPYVFTSKTLNACTGMNDENNKAYDDFEYDLIQCLMPHIEQNYSVATGKANTAITGFSMGGRESLNIGTKHADLFGYVGSICAAPGATPNFNFASEADAPSLIFMTAGSNDQTVYTTPEGYHNSATQAGVPHIWHYVNGGYHGDNSIHAHIYNFIRYIFKA